MNQIRAFLSRNGKLIAFVVGLLVAGALFRWEIREIDDAHTGKRLTTYHGIAFPWQACGPGTGHENRLINFHVRHWLLYGLVKIEATGQTIVISHSDFSAIAMEPPRRVK